MDAAWHSSFSIPHSELSWSPTGLLEAGNHPLEGQLAELVAADAELAQVSAAAAGELAAVADAHGGGVAREAR